MKNLFWVLLCLLTFPSVAQVITPSPTGNEPVVQFGMLNSPMECGTRPRSAPVKVPATWQNGTARKAGVLPYCIRTFITVFANDNGMNRAATDADLYRQFGNMVAQYQQQSICFVLLGIRQVNNSDLNDQNVSDEAGELSAFREPNCLTIFVHNQLRVGTNTLNGDAYDIPNTNAYISISSGAISSTSNLTTMAHEVGHVFGLYHTFESSNGRESVARTGSCRDCEDESDYVCDTQADPIQDDPRPGFTPDYLVDNTTNPGCFYTGNRVDECGVPYIPDVANIMTYGLRFCRSRFSGGQGTRLRYFLANESAFAAILAPESSFAPILGPAIYTAGNLYEVARDVLTVGEFNPYQVYQSANVLAISKRIVLKPGVRFSPGAGGRVQVTTNLNCQ